MIINNIYSNPQAESRQPREGFERSARNEDHVWNIVWFICLIIWDYVWHHFRTILVPKVTLAPPSRHLRGPSHPQTKGPCDGPRAPIWSPKWAKGRPQSAKWTPDGAPKESKMVQKSINKTIAKKKQKAVDEKNAPKATWTPIGTSK